MEKLFLINLLQRKRICNMRRCLLLTNNYVRTSLPASLVAAIVFLTPTSVPSRIHFPQARTVVSEIPAVLWRKISEPRYCCFIWVNFFLSFNAKGHSEFCSLWRGVVWHCPRRSVTVLRSNWPGLFVVGGKKHTFVLQSSFLQPNSTDFTSVLLRIAVLSIRLWRAQ
jgi:hypothetical protein